MLNCKQGDLAIIVKSYAGNEGKIVRCLRYIGSVYLEYGKDIWLIDKEINGTVRCGNYCDDSQLRPIRDQDGEDEILRIAGKPKSSNNELVNLLQKLTY